VGQWELSSTMGCEEDNVYQKAIRRGGLAAIEAAVLRGREGEAFLRGPSADPEALLMRAFIASAVDPPLRALTLRYLPRNPLPTRRPFAWVVLTLTLALASLALIRFSASLGARSSALLLASVQCSLIVLAMVEGLGAYVWRASVLGESVGAQVRAIVHLLQARASLVCRRSHGLLRNFDGSCPHIHCVGYHGSCIN